MDKKILTVGLASLIILVSGGYWIYQQNNVSSGLEINPLQTQEALRTPEGRQALYDWLSVQKASTIWTMWDAVIARNNPDEYGQVTPAMGQALLRDSPKEIYGEITKRLYDQSRGLQERSFILGALQYAATPEAIQILIGFSQSIEGDRQTNGNISSEQETLLNGAQQSIREVSRGFIDGARNWAISSALENGWKNFGKNELLSTRSTIANAIVYVGKPEGLSVLINSVENDGLSADVRLVALSAISGLSSNDAVPTLGEALKQSTDLDLTKALIQGLASAGSADAMWELLDYVTKLVGVEKQEMQKEILKTLAGKTLSAEALKVLRGSVLEIKQ